MKKRSPHASVIKLVLGHRLRRYEVRVGNLGISFTARATDPVEVELRDLSDVTDPFTTAAPAPPAARRTVPRG